MFAITALVVHHKAEASSPIGSTIREFSSFFTFTLSEKVKPKVQRGHFIERLFPFISTSTFPGIITGIFPILDII
jgi:hypothetical protein